MAIQDTDLLLAYRTANKTHYKLSIKDISQELPSGNTNGDVLTWNGTTWNPEQPTNELPAGTIVGQYLRWNGTTWEASNTIDGGEYAT